MKKHLFGMALLTCLVFISGMAMAQTIDDIQVYDALGAPASPFAGQSVTVTGSITVIKGTYNSGTFYLQGATGGINFFSNSAGPFALGDVVEVSGTVGAFGGEINVSSPVAVFLSSGAPVVPTPKTPAELQGNYEEVGNLISVIGTVSATNINGGSDSFWIHAGTDTVEVFVDSDTGADLSSVAIGDLYEVSGPFIVYNGTLEMKPRFQADLVENPGSDTLPVIASINSPDWVVDIADPLTITAVITDNSGIASAMLYYADSDGTTQGAFSAVAMTNTSGDNYEGTIPGGHTGSQVDYYLEATDDGAQTITLPGTAPTAFESVAVGFTTIYAMNTAHPDSAYQGSPLLDRFINIKGIVTVGTDNSGAASRFIVQEADKNPATNDYSYGGVLVYEGTGTYPYFSGDEVEISGTVGEFFGLTEMIPLNADASILVSLGNALPEASLVTSRELGDNSLLDGNGILGERWESVWVTTFPSVVLDTLGFGDYIVSTTGVRADSMDIDPVPGLVYTPTIGDVLTLTSYMTYNGQYELIPFADEFIINTGLSAAPDTPTIVSAGGFRSVSPNPFNPMTTIKFVVNKSNLVQLNVYNIRGQLVRTLVQDRLPASSEHTYTFDGTNDAGQKLASGAYFARLRIGREVVQVRQMMLVK